MTSPDRHAAPDQSGTPPPAELRLSRDLLTVICWLVMAAMFAIAVMMGLTGVFENRRLAGQLLIAAVALVGLVLARANRLQASAGFMSFGFIAALTYFGIITGGHLTPSTLGYFVVIAAAGWYLGRNTTIALAAASLTALAGLAYAQTAGWLPEPAPTNPMYRWLTQAIVFTIGTLLVVAASRAMGIRLAELDKARQGFALEATNSAERAAQLRLIANSVPAMIFHGGPDMRCRWANEAYARFVGLDSEAIIGRHLRDSFGEPLFETIRPHIDRVLAGEQVLYEATHPGPAGEPRQLEIELIPDRVQDGSVRGWFGMVRDVTERRQREQLLPLLVKGTARATGDAFFTSLVSQIGNAFGTAFAMVAETTDGGARAHSLAFWSSSGFLPNVQYDLAGAPCRHVVDNGSAHFPTGVAGRFPDDKTLAARGIEGYFGVALRNSEGAPIGLLVVMHTAALWLNPDQTATMEIFASRAAAELERMRLDNSLRESNIMLERRVEERTAQLTEANRDLEAFSYSVSHDLRAPLRSIDGFSRLIETDYAERLDSTGRDHIRRVRRSTQRMGQLIDDLLELSSVSRQTLRLQPVDLTALGSEVAEELRGTEPERVVTILLSPDCQACGDPGLLRVLMENLLGNAWKYTGRQVHPRIEFGCEEKEGKRVFFVKDNGAGFDMAYAGKLFAPFQRMHKAAEFEGTGVGLASVARIVSRHGGRIWAEAAVGRGATFYFTLPGPDSPSGTD